MPMSHIADELSISVPTVTERIKKLQEAGVIQGIHAVLDPKTLGLDVAALITLISESSLHYKDVTNAANKTSVIEDGLSAILGFDFNINNKDKLCLIEA